MKQLPANVKAYHRTPDFDAASVPAGLLREHRTKAGTWGLIVIEKGELLYRILEPEVEEILLTTERSGVVEPGLLQHHLLLPPPVRLSKTL